MFVVCVFARRNQLPHVCLQLKITDIDANMLSSQYDSYVGLANVMSAIMQLLFATSTVF